MNKKETKKTFFPLSSNTSYHEYLLLAEATSQVLSSRPGSHAYFDFHRGKAARKVYGKYLKDEAITEGEAKQFLIKAINPRLGSEFSIEEYERLYSLYGEGVVRLALVDGNFLRWLRKSSFSEVVLSTGGICALERCDLENIRNLKARISDKSAIKQFIDNTIDNAPMWTQVTSSIVPINGVSVMYDETFPWHLQVDALGSQDSKEIVSAEYDRIYDAVKRFAKLQNPNSVVIRIPFSELLLDELGYLKEWFDQYESYVRDIERKYSLPALTFNEKDCMRAWVAYTYFGPQILPRVLDIIKHKYPELYDEHNLDQCTIHVRGKQIDHLTIKRSGSWQNSLLLNAQTHDSERHKHLISITQNRYEVAYNMWHRDNAKKRNDIGFAGILDFNVAGAISHEESICSVYKPLVKSESELFDKLLNSPLRLHRKNIESVLRYLSKFTESGVMSYAHGEIDKLTSIQNNVSKLNRKIERITQSIEISRFFQKILKRGNSKNSLISFVYANSNFSDVKLALSEFQLFLERYHSSRELHEFFKKNVKDPMTTPRDFLKKLMDALVIKKESKKGFTLEICFSEPANAEWNYFFLMLERHAEKDELLLEQIKRDYQNNIKQLDLIEDVIVNNVADQRYSVENKQIRILPLCDNLFFSYMQQLLFIPSIRSAYLEMVEIEQADMSHETKVALLIEAMNQVYPHICDSIRYILQDLVEYPWTVRFENNYKKVLR